MTFYLMFAYTIMLLWSTSK